MPGLRFSEAANRRSNCRQRPFLIVVSDLCVRRSPDGALAYVADRLNPKQFAFCRRKMPEDALEHEDAASLLSPEQLALRVEECP